MRINTLDLRCTLLHAQVTYSSYADIAFTDSFLVMTFECWLDPTQYFSDNEVLLIACIQSTV